MTAHNDVLSNVSHYALDMDGTIYLSDELIPGAKEFLERLHATGKKFVFLTNNSSKNRQSYVDKLHRLGIPVAGDQVLTSGEATALYIKKRAPKARIFLLGTPDLEHEFQSHGFLLTAENPDFVVLGFDLTLTYAKLAEACHLIREGVPFIATHPDFNCPTADRSGYIPDVGAMLDLIFASTGKRAKIIGKPHQEMIDVLLDKFDCERSQMAMVGDRLYTDIQFAKNANILGILVLSGETKRADLDHTPIRPDIVFESVRELCAALPD